MARIFTEGFETGDNLGFNPVTSSVTIISTNPRSGSYCAKFSAATSIGTIIIPATGELYVRFGFMTGQNNKVDIRFAWMSDSTVLGHLRVQNNGLVNGINAYSSTSTLLANGTINITANTWYLVEIYIKIGDNPNGRVITKIDGITDIDFTGDTQPAAITTINRIDFKGQGGVGEENYFDDIAINNTSGTSDNSWCGDGHIIALIPDSAGDVTQLIPSSGSSNWSLVDERPANTTDYVSGSVIGEYDLYNLTPFSVSNAAVKRIWAETRSLDTVAEGGTISIGIKVNGEGEDWGSYNSLLTTYYRYIGTVYPLTPSGSAIWTSTNLNNLQIGIKTGT